MFFFYLFTTISTPWPRQKVFFSFSHYDHYAMIKREKSFFHLATIFTNEERKIFFFIYWLWSLPHHKERKFLFHLAKTITMPWSREKKVCFMYPPCSLMKKEKYFFSFSYYDHSALIKKKKVFFSFSYYDHYPMIKRKKGVFHLATMFTNEEIKNFFFHLATTITMPWSRQQKVFFI